MKSIVKSRYHWTSNVASVVISTLGVIAFTGCGDDDTTIIIPPAEQDAGLDAGGTDATGTGDPTSAPTDTKTDTDTDPTGGETSDDDDAGVTDPGSTDDTEPSDTSSDTSDDTSTGSTGVIPPDAGGGNNDPDASVDPGEATQPPEGASLVLTTFANPGTKSNDGVGILMTGAKEESEPEDQHQQAGFAVANSIATFEAVFTGQVQSYRVQLPANGFDATGHTLLVRLRILSSMENESASPGVQIVSWSDGWGWDDTFSSITEDAFDWVVYEMDMDTVKDPANLQAVGFQITTGGWSNDGMEYSEPDTVRFQVDWVAFVPKAEEPDGGTGDAGPDAGWDDDAGLDDDAGVPDGGDDDFQYIVTDMDGPELSTGYYSPEGSMVDDTEITFADSIAQFVTAFTGPNEDFRVAFGTNGQDFTGRDLAIRFRVVSGLEPGMNLGLQLVSWSDPPGDGGAYTWGDKWLGLNGNDDHSDWHVYRAPIDEFAANVEVVNMLGFAVNTGGEPGPIGSVTYEIDWIAVLPSESD